MIDDFSRNGFRVVFSNVSRNFIEFPYTKTLPQDGITFEYLWKKKKTKHLPSAFKLVSDCFFDELNYFFSNQ